MSQIIGYRVIDTKTMQQVRNTYGADKRHLAQRMADKLDLEYGAVRYVVQPIWQNTGMLQVFAEINILFENAVR